MTNLQPYTKYYPVSYEYVQSLPDGWQLLPNIAVFRERKEKGTKNEELLSIVASRGVIKTSDYELKKDRSTDDKSEYLLIKKGDLAYNTMLTWIGAYGYSQYQGIVSPAYTVLKPIISINPKFFHYQFRSDFYKHYSKRYAYGIMDVRLRLYYFHFKRMYSVVPPLEVQNSIVEYLDKKNSEIDKFIQNKEKLIALLEEQKTVIINQAIVKGLDENPKVKYSGFEWLGEVPKHWGIKKLRYLGKFQNGISAGAEYFGSGYPFVSYSDVYKNITLPSLISDLANSSKEDRIRYSVLEGDVFFTRTSETVEEIGFSSICETTIKDATFSGFLIRFRPFKNLLYKGYSKYYFRSSLHRRFFVKEMNLVTRASLSQDLLKNLPVIIPSYNEQKNIAKFLDVKMDDIDLIIVKIKKEIAAIKEYREALITDLVTGKRSIPQTQRS